MSGDVADVTQASKEGGEINWGEAVFERNGLFVFILHAFVKTGEADKVEDFNGYPDWELFVGVLIVSYKVFVSGAMFELRVFFVPLLETSFSGSSLFGGEVPVKVLRIVVSFGVVFPNDMSNIDSDRHFNSFQGIKGEETKFFVEDVEFYCFFESAAGDEFIFSKRFALWLGFHFSEGIPVAAQAVVANAFEVIEGCWFVFDDESSAF